MCFGVVKGNNNKPLKRLILEDNLPYYKIDNGNEDSNPKPPFIAEGNFCTNDKKKQFKDSVKANPDSVGNNLPKYTN